MYGAIPGVSALELGPQRGQYREIKVGMGGGGELTSFHSLRGQGVTQPPQRCTGTNIMARETYQMFGCLSLKGSHSSRRISHGYISHECASRKRVSHEHES